MLDEWEDYFESWMVGCSETRRDKGRKRRWQRAHVVTNWLWKLSV